ncbi:murein hydrolase activator EnvC [Mannheimia massilioguelmaensis]|uniref:murein hydrolase activator EnvC n=1 Tax=Mannheimia massilioguelmaensis TaxID=1604354 RepID=UPI0005CAB0E6|nr:murein hydrolase activator EnvC [Mannheimia massilioguelmaensis]
MLSNFNKKISLKCTALFCVGMLGTFSAQSADLSKIQQQIKQQEQKIAEQKRTQNQLQSILQAQETKMSGVIGNLRQTQADVEETRKVINETNKQIKLLEQQEKTQKIKLAKQLDAVYRSGNPASVVEHLLSDNAQKADRMKVYYEHMNQARMTAIQDIRDTRKQLDEQKNLLSSQLEEQKTQLSTQKKQQQELQKVKNERQLTLNQLSKSLEKDQNKLETLKANENALRNEIQRASEMAQEQEQREREAYTQKKASEEKKNNRPYQPTNQEQQLMHTGTGLAGKYPRPVIGKTLYSYGATQVGEVKWKGMVIGASAGTAVKAIADGRVILASWLQGYGLVVVIDHGKGDMSLYGYNQAVSVKVGNLVRSGQKIAEVGNSGGQGRTGLYFEIRRQGNAVNPASWLR